MHHVSIQGHSRPKRAPAAKPRSNTRQDKCTNARRGHAPGPNSGGAADPNAHRRHSRRSSTQLGKRTRAKLKAPGVRVRQDNPTHAGPRAKQPAPGSGEPRKRLKLRSAMHNYVSCLGMTTQKVSASVRFHRTQRRQKALFFGAYPVSLARQKKWGTVFVRLFKAPLTPESGNYSSWWRTAPSSWAEYS